MDDDYVNPKEACKIAHVHISTLRSWEEAGKIRTFRTAGGHRRYCKNDLFENAMPKEEINYTDRKKICYARVSTDKQKEDLERQVSIFKQEFESHIIITDIGSGLNYKRKGLKSILDLAITGNLEEVVVTHKDRLCRFGFELIDGIIRDYSNGRILVLNHKETSPEEELSNDIISIITVFSARLHGLRSHANKKRIKEKSKELENTKIQTVSE